jgi:hypothetical protein
MKSWIIAGGCLTVCIISGVLMAVFSMPVEYTYGEPQAYVDGATPSQIEHWEMY